MIVAILLDEKTHSGSQAAVVMPVILANWEAEIGKIIVQGQTGQIIVCKTSS
jgi:hypothetical protein